MTKDELRAAREKLGLSTAKLARVLQLGTGGDRTVRRWEAGHTQISGPAAVALRYMLQYGVPPEPPKAR